MPADPPRETTPEPPQPPHIRPAGPDPLVEPQEDWDETDQASDESFPASDPPGMMPGAD